MKKILVVVDYQNDFVNGSLGFSGADRLDAGISEKIDETVAAGGYVLVTQDYHPENYLKSREGKALPISHCIKGTKGADIFGQTQQSVKRAIEKDKACYLKKQTFGVDPEKLIMFKEWEPDEVEFVGLVTNMCVIANVCCFQALWPEAQMVVDAALVDSFDKDLHAKALDVLKGMQVQVKN